MALSDKVWALLSGPTVLNEMEKDPKASPTKIAENLFGEKAVKKIENRVAKSKHARRDDDPITQEELDRAATTGGFPSRPSDLFLKVRSVPSS